MTIRERFQLGDRVIENEHAPRSSRRRRDGIYRAGIVVGYSRHVEAVRVKFDGHVAVYAFHASFLDNLSRAH